MLQVYQKQSAKLSKMLENNTTNTEVTIKRNNMVALIAYINTDIGFKNFKRKLREIVQMLGIKHKSTVHALQLTEIKLRKKYC